MFPGKDARKTTRPRKLSDTEKNIKFLEQKKHLFPYEQLKLNNMKEQQALLHGVPIESLENKNEKSSDDSGDMGRLKNTSENSSDEDSNLELKQSFPGAFVLYKREKIAEMKRITPAHKIGKDFSVDDWNRLTDNEKKVYHDRAAAEKLKLGKHFRKHIKSRGKSETEKKEAKRLANKKHKDMKEGEKSAKEET